MNHYLILTGVLILKFLFTIIGWEAIRIFLEATSMHRKIRPSLPISFNLFIIYHKFMFTLFTNVKNKSSIKKKYCF